MTRYSASPEAKEDLRIAARILRIFGRFSTATEMAGQIHVHRTTISRYETGARPLEGVVLEQLALAADVPMWAVEGVLLPAIALIRATRTAEALPDDDRRERLAELVTQEGALVSAAVAEFLAGSPEDPEALRRSVEIADPWETQLPVKGAISNAASDRYLAYEDCCLDLWAESIRAGYSDPVRALRLARLAVRVAGLAPGPAPATSCLAAVAWGVVANAHRVGNNLAAAASTFPWAWRRWREGEPYPESRLGEWRLLDLEASLRRDQRRFDEALELLDRAFEGAPPQSKGRILINRSSILEQAGRIQEAAAAMDAAAPLIETNSESWMLRYNRAVLVWRLGRSLEAEEELGDLHSQAVAAGDELDVLRVQWLQGRVSQGLGRLDQARTAFEEVRGSFARRGLAYDAALVTLDLALLHLEAGRGGDVRALASEMLITFTALKVNPEAMAAIHLFHQSAEMASLTVEVARGIVGQLERARNHSALSVAESV